MIGSMAKLSALLLLAAASDRPPAAGTGPQAATVAVLKGAATVKAGKTTFPAAVGLPLLRTDEVTVPAYRGQLEIFPGHAPLMTSLGTGILKYKAKGGSSFESVVVSWGYAQVNPEGVIVLAETAESIEEIDRARAEAARKKAETELMEPILEADQIAKIQHKLARANARIAAVDGDKSH